VRAALRWQARLTPNALAAEADVTSAAAASSLSVLGARGLVGFDVGEAASFHRELPFDLELVEALQPRLLDARMLVDQAGVRVVSDTGEAAEAYVRGTDVEHRVRANGEDYRCTCPWFSRNQGERGPCKHILALQIVREDDAAR
jgi:predicted nucleic acid-binding Zn finger protein